jgi:hypothetical protein
MQRFLHGQTDSRLAAAAADPDSSPESTPENKIIVHRTLHGSTQSHGVLAVRLTNPGAVIAEVAYLETLPWIVQLYVHTLRVSVHDVPRRRCSVPQLISELIDLQTRSQTTFNSSFLPIAKTPINYIYKPKRTAYRNISHPFPHRFVALGLCLHTRILRLKPTKPRL